MPGIPPADLQPILQTRVCPTSPRGKTLVPPDHSSGQTDLKLADAVNANVKNTTVVGQAARDVEAPEQRSEKPDSTESAVREGKQPSLVPDSGYGPSLWTGELDTPKQRLSFSEVPDRPCGRRGGAEVCYSSTSGSELSCIIGIERKTFLYNILRQSSLITQNRRHNYLLCAKSRYAEI